MSAICKLLMAAALLLCCLTAGAADFTVADSVLTVAPGVRAIPESQFADRTDFHTVRFERPCALVEIGDFAFMGCVNLRDIELPATLCLLGEGAFRECSSLTAVDLPRKVKTLKKQTFAWCWTLRHVGLREVADIGSHAFAYCESLDDVHFSTRLFHVGSNAFAFCSSLRQVSLPNTVRELESYAFAECVSLVKARLPGNDRMLGELIFSGCRDLREIVIDSYTPPVFDCNSTLFEQNESFMYDECRLYVHPKAVALYRQAPGWKLFRHILPLR